MTITEYQDPDNAVKIIGFLLAAVGALCLFYMRNDKQNDIKTLRGIIVALGLLLLVIGLGLSARDK